MIKLKRGMLVKIKDNVSIDRIYNGTEESRQRSLNEFNKIKGKIVKITLVYDDSLILEVLCEGEIIKCYTYWIEGIIPLEPLIIPKDLLNKGNYIVKLRNGVELLHIYNYFTNKDFEIEFFDSNYNNYLENEEGKEFDIIEIKDKWIRED